MENNSLLYIDRGLSQGVQDKIWTTLRKVAEENQTFTMAFFESGEFPIEATVDNSQSMVVLSNSKDFAEQMADNMDWLIHIGSEENINNLDPDCGAFCFLTELVAKGIIFKDCEVTPGECIPGTLGGPSGTGGTGNPGTIDPVENQ